MIDDHDIERIAAAMNQLRPDWPVNSLRTFIAKNLATRARRDVAVALAWVACESNTASPARVLENGPWWKAAGVTGELTPRHVRREDACGTCGREYADGCCDEPVPYRPIPTDPAAYQAEVRRLRSLLTNTEEN